MNGIENLKSKILKEFSKCGIRLFLIGHEGDKHYFQIFYNQEYKDNGISVGEIIINRELRKLYKDNATLTLFNTDELPENIDNPNIEVVYDRRWVNIHLSGSKTKTKKNSDKKLGSNIVTIDEIPLGFYERYTNPELYSSSPIVTYELL